MGDAHSQAQKGWDLQTVFWDVMCPVNTEVFFKPEKQGNWVLADLASQGPPFQASHSYPETGFPARGALCIEFLTQHCFLPEKASVYLKVRLFFPAHRTDIGWKTCQTR